MNEDYVKNSNKKIHKEIKEKNIGKTKIFIKDPLPEHINLENVFETLRQRIPFEYLDYIDYIMIGDFELLKKKNVNAAYAERVIYLTNKQDDEDDITDDIVHEIAHSVEENLTLEIYSDGRIESEFISKRERLYHLLEGEKFDVDYQDFMETQYSQNFDNFLYHEVGYQLMANLAANLFYSPYGATSLREYFANGFEAYFYHQDLDKLASISPVLFDKLENLSYNKE